MAYHDVEDELRTKQDVTDCKRDIAWRNSINEKLYTEEEKVNGRILKEKVQSAYFRSRVFLNYRENSIAVKVEAPQLADKVSAEVTKLHLWCKANGIKQKTTRASIVYHIE